MNERELRALPREQMYRVLHEQKNEIERLTEENNELIRRLNERRLQPEQAGSIIETSRLFSGVLQAAQEAADVYLESVRSGENETKRKYDGVMTALLRAATEMQNLIDLHMEQLAVLRLDFQAMLQNTGIQDQTGKR